MEAGEGKSFAPLPPFLPCKSYAVLGERNGSEVLYLIVDLP
jgi:hypothetical protein